MVTITLLVCFLSCFLTCSCTLKVSVKEDIVSETQEENSRLDSDIKRSYGKFQNTTEGTEEEEEDEIINGQGSKKRDTMKLAAIGLATSFAAIVGISNPVTGTVIAIGVTVLQPMIEELGGESKIWDKIEDKVEAKIGEKLAESAVHDLKDRVLYPLNRRIMKGDQFGPNDLETILDKMEEVIPSNPVRGWNYDLPLLMVYYLPYMIAGYHQVIKDDNNYPVCALANQMNHYRSRVIYGLKEMMRKRYKAIIPDSWDERSYNCKKPHKRVLNKNHTTNLYRKGTSEGPSGSQYKRCDEYLSIYEDVVTKKNIRMVRRDARPVESWSSVINRKVRKPAVDFLYKEIAQKINSYLTSVICLSDLECKCPTPIQKSDFDVGWPSACYGRGKRDCLFPAGRFGESYHWCWDTGINDNYSKTDAVDLTTCMRIPQDIPDPLNIFD